MRLTRNLLVLCKWRVSFSFFVKRQEIISAGVTSHMFPSRDTHNKDWKFLCVTVESSPAVSSRSTGESDVGHGHACAWARVCDAGAQGGCVERLSEMGVGVLPPPKATTHVFASCEVGVIFFFSFRVQNLLGAVFNSKA